MKVSVSQNHIILVPTALWKASPVHVFLMMPAQNGVWEKWLDEFNYKEIGRSFRHHLPLDDSKTKFTCLGLRFRATAMPEATGKASIDILREQDPPGPANKRQPAVTLRLERLSMMDPITLAVDLLIEPEP